MPGDNPKIHPVSWAKIHPKFMNSLAHRFGVSKISALNPVKADSYPRSSTVKMSTPSGVTYLTRIRFTDDR